jgi:hypothetical protein
MQTHLGTTKHVTTLEQLCALVESHLQHSQKKRKRKPQRINRKRNQI